MPPYRNVDSLPVGLHYGAPVGNMVMVADSGTGRTAWSASGSSWALGTGGSTFAWSGVAYSPALRRYVAVANNSGANRTMTSDDGGRTWTIGTLPVGDRSWLSVAWSPRLRMFAACRTGASFGNIMTSPDGIVWSVLTLANLYQATQIYWCEPLRRFVAAGTSGGNTPLLTSADGVNWVEGTPQNFSATVRCFAWHDRLRLGVIETANAAIQSSPSAGVSDPWTTRALSTAMLRMAYASNLGLLFGGIDALIKTSADVVNWSSQNMGGALSIRDARYSRARRLLVIVPNSGSPLRLSRDGVAWAPVTVPDREWRALATGD